MKTVEIKCPYCGTVKNMSQIKLTAFYGKTVQTTCKKSSCQKIIQFKADADLFNQEKGQEQAEQRRFKTEIIDNDNQPNVSQSLQLTVIENEWTAAQTIQLSEGENIIGRSSNSNSPTKRNVITRDKVMSRNHFKITVEKNEEKYYFALKDIGSKNGTKLNDKSLGGNEVLVQVNNTITAGKTFFKLG
jgi:hypothetical protein